MSKKSLIFPSNYRAKIEVQSSQSSSINFKIAKRSVTKFRGCLFSKADPKYMVKAAMNEVWEEITSAINSDIHNQKCFLNVHVA